MSISGDDFTIKDAVNPAHHYKLKSSALSMKGARALHDSTNRTILNMSHKVPPAAYPPPLACHLIGIVHWARGCGVSCADVTLNVCVHVESPVQVKLPSREAIPMLVL